MTSSIRAAVEWDEGWYAGSIQYPEEFDSHPETVKKFQNKHGRSPDIIVNYDDHFTFAYGVLPGERKILDEDGDRLSIKELKISTVGGGSYAIWWQPAGQPETKLVPAGVGVSSFIAKVTALKAAIMRVLEKVRRGWRGIVRIVTDSQSVMENLQTPVRQQSNAVQQLSKLLSELSVLCPVHILWVPSHCGILKNELVDTMAKEALKIPLCEQIRVPIDLSEVRRVSTTRNSVSLISELPDEFENILTLREAETALAQKYVGHTPSLHPLGSHLFGKKLVCNCRPGVLNDVDHYLLRCPKRNLSRRLCLPPSRERQEKSVSSIVRKWPVRVLAFLVRERFFEQKRSAPSHN